MQILISDFVAAEFPKTPSPKPARRRGLGRNAGGFRIRQIIFSPIKIHI
ncbi:MAG: hypothetical protein UU49_C0009G0016 [Candidatus Magasanikbacteria bacterium GW2011_GWC2_41_17]|uniref:Uncharacterized protein n=1 Tax=Candidatus Magasanikbacteria bacterium GW2011_GWC2_41_17 TaxID=1619048 RepID=A0A0G0VEA7_9BACT|nr:MAG: hypothetical protein UU49_C0009G0016 [Candidatus Magasanikbacteria bacterium GW2011_GWC2_41_17]